MLNPKNQVIATVVIKLVNSADFTAAMNAEDFSKAQKILANLICNGSPKPEHLVAYDLLYQNLV